MKNLERNLRSYRQWKEFHNHKFTKAVLLKWLYDQKDCKFNVISNKISMTVLTERENSFKTHTEA